MLNGIYFMPTKLIVPIELCPDPSDPLFEWVIGTASERNGNVLFLTQGQLITTLKASKIISVPVETATKIQNIHFSSAALTDLEIENGVYMKGQNGEIRVLEPATIGTLTEILASWTPVLFPYHWLDFDSMLGWNT